MGFAWLFFCFSCICRHAFLGAIQDLKLKCNRLNMSFYCDHLIAGQLHDRRLSHVACSFHEGKTSYSMNSLQEREGATI